MATATLRLPLLAEGQAQPYVTANAAFSILDHVAAASALSASIETPPADPVEGDAYILPATAWGWTSANPPAGDPGAGDLAIYHGGAWHKVTPRIGWRWHVADLGGAMTYTAAGWRQGDVAGPLGASLGLALREAALDLDGPTATAAGLIPTRAIVLGVSTWTIETVTGATSFDCGIAGEASKFGGSLGAAVNSSNVGVVGPFATYSPTDVVLTANGGDFTGGRVGLAASVLLPRVPV